MQELTDDQKAMLELERQWWQYTGTKEQAVRDRFGLSMTKYYFELNWVIDQPGAMGHDPFTVKRLQRIRDRRKQRRADAVRAY